MAQVKIKFKNGHKVVAPVELWVYCIFEALTDQQADKVVERVMKFKDNSIATQRLLDELAPEGKPDVSFN